MRAADIRKLSTFFSRVDQLQRFMVTTAAAAKERGDCDCETNADGVWRPAGRCKPAGAPPDHCRSVVHLAARAAAHQLRLPVEHLTDEQFDTAIAGLAALVGRAPQVTEREFVIQMQQILRVTPEQAAVEETPAP